MDMKVTIVFKDVATPDDHATVRAALKLLGVGGARRMGKSTAPTWPSTSRSYWPFTGFDGADYDPVVCDE